MRPHLMLVGLLGSACTVPSTAGGHASPRPIASDAPPPSAATDEPAPGGSPACGATAAGGVLSLAAPTSPLGSEFLPDAFVIPQASPSPAAYEIDPAKLREAVLGSTPAASAPGPAAGVCLASAPPTDDPTRTSTGRIHRVAVLHPAAPDRAPRIVVLHTAVVPAALVFDAPSATWQLTVLDQDYRVVATTSFTTEITDGMTRDTLATHLRANARSLAVGIRVGLDCDGHKHDRLFSTTIAYDPGAPCIEVRRLDTGRLP